MPKTLDEIKEAMLHCSPVSCRSTGCPYKADTPKYEGDMPVCRMKLWHDMKHLIQQIEAQNAEKDERIQQLEKDKDDLLEERELNDFLRDRVKQLEADKKRAMENAVILSAAVRRLEAERDAAVDCLKKAANEKGECFGCKWYNGKNCTHPDYKMLCSSHDDKWEWRVAQKEE